MEMKTNLLLLLLLPFFFVSCVSLGRPTLPEKPKHREPAKGSKTYKPVGEWEVRNLNDLKPAVAQGATATMKDGVITLDLKGNKIDGSKQKGDGGQSEDQTPMLRARVPLIVKGGFVENNKNALVFYAPNSGVVQMTWLNIGEDAVATHDGAKNFLVDGCEFLNSGNGDKSIQLNEADGAIVRNNLIYGGITGARIGKIDYSAKTDVAECANNTFIGTDTAWGVGKIKLRVTKKNDYRGVRLPFSTTAGATISNADGDVKTN
jgi:hypothetical protein